jgi:crotonobetainyl-CoA hydratase
LLPSALSLAARVAAAAPLAIAAVKDIVRSTESLGVADAFARMRSLSRYRAVLASDDAREGPLAFAEKRPPRWRGA